MKTKIIIMCTIILLISISMPIKLTRADDQEPLPPCIFYGYVYVNGKPAQDNLTVTATISGATMNWTTQTRNGTYGWPVEGSSLFGIPSNDQSGGEKDGGVQGDIVTFYVQGTRAPQTGVFQNAGSAELDLKVFLGTYVVIDRAFVSSQEANVGSTQTVGFHAEWGQNGSDVTAGIVTVQNMITFQNGQYVLNATGWITFNVASPTVQEQQWDVTGVNINGSTVYEQTAPNPSIIWNRIMIVDGGPTKESISPGQTVAVWFKAIYEYDNSTFDNSDGSSLYLNGSAMSWSQPNDRWEQNFTATTLGTDTFVITGFNDSLHGITAINLTAGTETITVSDKPAPASPILYVILAGFIIVAISVAVFFTRRRGNRLKVTKEAEKKKHPARVNKHKN